MDIVLLGKHRVVKDPKTFQFYDIDSLEMKTR